MMQAFVLIIIWATMVTSVVGGYVGTNATCQSGFNWTENSKGASSCLLAAIVISPCTENNYTVIAINGTERYTPPSGNTANVCSCSWAAYNLLSACTLCQGFPQSVQNWSGYASSCEDNLSNTYYPTGIVLPEGTLIPYYASTNPSSWTDATFNVQDAQVAGQGHADLTPNTPTKKSTPVGPIVGGVIGGVAGLGLVGLIAFIMLRRRKQRPKELEPTNSPLVSYPQGPLHARSPSDMSQGSTGFSLGYYKADRSFVTSPTMRHPMSPTSMHTHSDSIASRSYFGSVAHSTTYDSPSPPPGSLTSSPPPPALPPLIQNMNREDIIMPFTLHHSESQQHNTNTNLDGKSRDGAIIPAYDPPSSLPPSSALQGATLASNGTPNRPRLNPPAYSPSFDELPARPSHSKNTSADTTFSNHSNRSGTTTPRHGGDGSISAIEEVIEDMGLNATETASGTGGTWATGQSIQMQRNPVFRPVIGNPDPF